jgi:acyl transferase domain-containing protein
VKTNLGHSEAASGLTSVIKVALAFDKGFIPPTYGVKTLNPKCETNSISYVSLYTKLTQYDAVHLDSRNLKVVTELQSWPRKLCRASINSFGFGGANAHVILESPLSYLGPSMQKPRAQSSNTSSLLVLPVSAASKISLNLRVKQISKTMEHATVSDLEQLALTLGSRRCHMQNRHYLLVDTATDDRQESPKVMVSKEFDSRTTVLLPIAFVFTGQGAQYAEMAKGLLYTNKVFSNTIHELDNVLKSLLPRYAPKWTLEQTILDPSAVSMVNDVTRSQPICTAIQVALVNILRDWDISPVSVVGHSSGEIAAAYAAGLLTATQAILVAYFRGYAASRVQQLGLMMATGLGVEAAQALIVSKELEKQACVACVNASNSVTLSGSAEAISTLGAEIANRNVFVRKLVTGGLAYHSHLMKQIGPLYEQLLEENLSDTVSAKQVTTRLYSSVADFGSQVVNFFNLPDMVKYWRRNLEQPVHFSSALKNLIADGNHHLIEIGPHCALKGPIQRIREDLDITGQLLPYACTLIRGEDANLCMQNLAGSLFVRGHELNWSSVNNLPKSSLAHRDDLPTYPWDYSAGLLWYEPRASIELRNREYARHEILGSRQLADNGISWRWRNILYLDEMPWLRGHKVEKQIIFPATGYLAAIIEAISQIIGVKDDFADQAETTDVIFEFRDVNMNVALIVHDEDVGKSNSTELHTVVSKRRLSAATSSADWYDFEVSSWKSDKATLHCVGGVRVNISSDLQGAVIICDADNFEAQPPSRYYDKGRDEGIAYDGEFKSLISLRFDGNRKRPESLSTTRLIPMVARDPHSTYYPVHPITMDACLQAPMMGCTAGNIDRLEGYLPVFIPECQVRAIGRNSLDLEGEIHTRSCRTGVSTQRIDTTLRDPCKRTILNFKGVRMSLYIGKNADKGDKDEADLPRQPCLRALFKPDISRLFIGKESAINDYIQDFVKDSTSYSMEEDYSSSIEALVDLAGHRKPDMRAIEIHSQNYSGVKRWLQILDGDTGFPRSQSWWSAILDETGKIQMEEDGAGPFVSESWQ